MLSITEPLFKQIEVDIIRACMADSAINAYIQHNETADYIKFIMEHEGYDIEDATQIAVFFFQNRLNFGIISYLNQPPKTTTIDKEWWNLQKT